MGGLGTSRSYCDRGCGPWWRCSRASRDGTVHVRFGDHDVPVPEPLGVILTELIRTGRTHAASRLGIYATAGRRVALTDLAAQLPAAGRAHHRWRFHGDLRSTRDPTGQRGSGRSRGRAARRPPEIRAADNAHSTASTMEQPSTARKLPT